MSKEPQHQPIDKNTSDKPPKMIKYFHALIKANASDLHLKPGAVPHIRVKSLIRATQADLLKPEEIAEMAYELMTPKQIDYFEEHGSLDLAYQLKDSDRFRINVFRQRGNISMAIRRVSAEIPDFKALHLPDSIERIAKVQQGLVLISGATGSGKTTTIASMIEYINNTRPCHIVTIEDPIEYIFTDKKAIISQREIGIDVDNFDLALKYLMREDPDIVLIGEMRDVETFQAALQAAETGHLVMGTVHASTAAQTVGRILDLIGPKNRDAFRQSLAHNLQAIICQKLLPSVHKDLDRVPAVEVMVASPMVRQLIEDERDGDLGDAIRASETMGMQSFTKSLLELIEQDYIDPQVAYDVAPNADELKMMLKGISTKHAGLIGRG